MAQSVYYMNQGGYPEFSDAMFTGFLILMAVGAAWILIRGCVTAWRNRNGR